MTSLTMVVTGTAKTVGQLKINETLNLSDTPLYGYNKSTVVDQLNMVSIRDQLNATSVFKVPAYGSSVVNDAELLVLTITYYVTDISAVPGLTTDNAYDLCCSTRIAEATALGIGDFQAWRTQYFHDKFTVSNVVTTSESA